MVQNIVPPRQINTGCSRIFFISFHGVFLAMFITDITVLHPKRIISLVPSITELLFDIDLSEKLIGITRFCVHPSTRTKNVEKIGGTKKINIQKIISLQPDLIIANKEENNKEDVETLAALFPLLLTDVDTYESAIKMIVHIGIITDKVTEANDLLTIIDEGFKTIQKPLQPIKTIYLIWNDPYMTIGNDTFIHHMLQLLGLQNLFSHKERYPQLTIAQIKDAAPQVLLLSSEPFPFKQKHIQEIAAFLPNTSIMLADGEMFSWYGSRMKYMPQYFNNLVNEMPQVNS
ncbi:MAG: helical backbone metal receptor [Ferruginibacter sp.]